MNGQRVREPCIEDRLQRGILGLAGPVDTVLPTSPSDTACLGCLASAADARVGDAGWHHLCALYWQGRSERLQAGNGSRIRSRAPASPRFGHAGSSWSRWDAGIPTRHCAVAFRSFALGRYCDGPPPGRPSPAPGRRPAGRAAHRPATPATRSRTTRPASPCFGWPTSSRGATSTRPPGLSRDPVPSVMSWSRSNCRDSPNRRFGWNSWSDTNRRQPARVTAGSSTSASRSRRASTPSCGTTAEQP